MESVCQSRSEAGVRRPPVEAEPTAGARASKHRAASAASSFASSLTEIFNRKYCRLITAKLLFASDIQYQ